MKTPKAPKGYRKLKPGTIIKAGDLYYNVFGEWAETCAIGEKSISILYARKIKKK